MSMFPTFHKLIEDPAKRIIIKTSKVVAVTALVAGVITGLTVWIGGTPHVDYGTATKLTGRVAQYQDYYETALATTVRALGPGAKILQPPPDGPDPRRSSHLYGYNTYTLLPITEYDRLYGPCPPGQGVIKVGAYISSPTNARPRANQVARALQAAGYTTRVTAYEKDDADFSYTSIEITKNGFRGYVTLSALPADYLTYFSAEDTRKVITRSTCLPLNTLPAPRDQ